MSGIPMAGVPIGSSRSISHGKEQIVYEFLCERVIPGCTHRERGPNREKVHERALEHMREHHKDDPVEETRDRVIGDAMIFIPR